MEWKVLHIALIPLMVLYIIDSLPASFDPEEAISVECICRMQRTRREKDGLGIFIGLGLL